MDKVNQQFSSIWDALEDDPIRRKNIKLRSELLSAIIESIKDKNLLQREVAEMLEITQPRASALINGKIDDFRLDTLVDISHRLGLKISIKIAA